MAFNPKSRPILLLLGMVFCQVPVGAAPKKKAPEPPKTPDRPLIEMEMRHRRIRFSHEGRTLTQLRDFRRVIDPLQDAEASGLLDKSRKYQNLRWCFGIPGATAMIVSLMGPDNVRIWNGSRGNDGRVIAFFGGAVLLTASGILEGRAYDHKFNAVQRYNRVAQGETKVTLGVPTSERPISLGVVHTF